MWWECEDPKNPDGPKSYKYLTEFKIFDLTTEKISELKKKYNDSKETYEALVKKSLIQLWKDDLKTFSDAYDKWIEQRAKDDAELLKTGKKDTGKKKRGSKKAK